VFILDSLLIGSLRFVLDKIAAAAEAEAEDDAALRDQLLEAQMRLELGELSDQEFSRIERDLLARIREIKCARQEPVSVSARHKIAGVEVESYSEE
jgi:gas vesicle protein GvpG